MNANRAEVAASAPDPGVQAMPQSRTSSRTTLVRLVLLALFGWALYALSRKGGEERPESRVATLLDGAEARESVVAPVLSRARRRSQRQRFATSLAFATLFFAGAALSAGAGDAIVSAMDPDTTTAETTTETAPAEEPPAEESIPPAAETDAPAEEPPAEAPPAEGAPEEAAPEGEAPPEGAPEAAAPEAPAPEAGIPADGEPAPATDPGAPAEAAPPAAPSAGEAPAGPESGSPELAPPVLAPHKYEHDQETRAIDPEADSFDGYATIWLHRVYPDPTPPAKRLAPAFARRLRAEARRAGIDWALLLGALRAEGADGRTPATRAKLRSLAGQLDARLGAGEWEALLALHGRTAYADRALALTRYNRAVGLPALVTGLDASKKRLGESTLADERLDIYAAGRGDIAAGRINVRVLVLLRYLAEAHGQVTVSSLQTGHRLYARPGVISAHIYGLAADISMLGSQSIMGNSQPGGLTEQGVRNILLLPAELRPQQVISLLGLGGPSFPLANHADHIHVGY
jgi:cytoskeletal protein RodZ